MRRIPRSLFPVLLVLLSVLAPKGQLWGQPVEGQNQAPPRFDQLAQELQLADSQRDSLEQLHRTYMESKRPLFEEMKIAFKELHALMSQAEPNPAEVYEKVEQINQLRNVVLHNSLASLLERTKILTPEQRGRLNQMPGRGPWSLMSGGPWNASLPPPGRWIEMLVPQE